MSSQYDGLESIKFSGSVANVTFKNTIGANRASADPADGSVTFVRGGNI